MSDARKWACEYCTYQNYPATKRCTLCRAWRPPRLITEDHINREQDIYKVASLLSQGAEQSNISTTVSSGSPTNNQWSCHVCTYRNWLRVVRCSQCLTPRKKMQSPVIGPMPDKMRPLSVNVSDNQASKTSTRNSPNSPEATKEFNNDRNKALAGYSAIKWTCKACTYENWPKTSICVLCGTSKGRQSPCGSNILEQETQRKTRRSSPNGFKNTSNQESLSPDGATASAIIISEDKNRLEGKRLRFLRKRLRDADWLWLNACSGVVDGDPHAVEAYIASGCDTTRQLTQDEVAVLNRASAFEVGYTLVHLAIRFQREDILAVLLTATDVTTKAVKRLPSHTSPDMAAEARRELSASIRQRKGDFPCYFTTECVSFALPADIADFPRHIQTQLFDELLDKDVQNELEFHESIINWSIELTDRLGSRLYALWNRTAGDCLLDSVMQATWGVFDIDNTLRRALADSLSEGAMTFYPQWKEFETLQAQSLHFSLDEGQWQRDWAVLLSLASQPGTSLEQSHIFALAHILRRPIIVYGVKYVKSFRGESIGFARFQGVYLPLLWEKSFCWKTPIALGYTRGHFSALVTMEMDMDDSIGAGANIESNDDGQLSYLPLVDQEGKVLPVHFLTRSQVGRDEPLLREWLECCVTKGGLLVAIQRFGKRPLIVRQLLDEWLDHYRQLSHVTSPHQACLSSQTFSSDGESDDE